MTSFYRREVLQQALSIIWRKKYLWFIALFAGISTYGGEVNFLFSKYNTIATFQNFLRTIRSLFLEQQIQPYLQKIQSIWGTDSGRISLYLLLSLLVTAFIIWLMIVSQAAIVRIVGRTSQKKNTGFFDGVATGTMKFWDLVQMNIIAFLFGWGLWVLITATPAAIYLINGVQVWATIANIGTVVTVIFSAIIAFLIQFATASMVLQSTPLIPAIVESWRLFRRNVLVCLEMAVIIFALNLGVLLVTFGVTILLIQPYSVGGLLTLIAVMALEYAVMTAYSFAAWTIVYQKLVEGKAESKIGRWTNQLVNFTKPKQIVS
ncbi:MAG: hypothetical protein HY975_04545 [Candidatus Kerfeldbacteria bacterium]|nr:hypothetical protein [Candidatus Kerfeldbacteria bacterium]